MTQDLSGLVVGNGWPDDASPGRALAPLTVVQLPSANGDPHAPVRSPRSMPFETFDHRVQFYERDDFLCDVVAAFFAEGQAHGEPMIMVATEPHRQDLVKRLEAEHHDVAALCAAEQLVLLDAEATLSQFMSNGMPDPDLFKTTVGRLVRKLRASSRNGRLRAYGEMVDLLWRGGNAEGTLALEGLWNDLSQTDAFSLLCGYSIRSFDQDGHSAPLVRVCDSHRRVAPAETYSVHADSPQRLRQLALLQHRAQVLEREVEHRKKLEQVLQAALLQRRRVEDELRASQQELKALEHELRRQNADLSRTVRFSEMFVGILGHDLRNPLSAIATAASLLRRRAESDKVAKPAGRILSSAARMGRMIDQLLDFTRIRLGEGIPVTQRQTDLGEICRLAIDELEAIGNLRAVELRLRGDVVGCWDADRLLQLVSNLVSNAVVHGTAPRTVTIHIDGSDAQTVVLDIHNTGVVPEEMLPLLFEPFRSGSNQKAQGSHGLGLGLFISQQIARAHAGHIKVSSSEPDGTNFTVSLLRVPRVPKAVFGCAGDGV